MQEDERLKEGGVDGDGGSDQAVLEFGDGGGDVAGAFEAGTSILIILGEGVGEDCGGFGRAEDAEGAGRFVVALEIGRIRYRRLRLGVGLLAFADDLLLPGLIGGDDFEIEFARDGDGVRGGALVRARLCGLIVEAKS